MAFTKSEKSKMMEQYAEWMQKSSAMFMMSYKKMNMKDVDSVRRNLREVDGEGHVLKNTLLRQVLEKCEYSTDIDLTGTTFVAFAFSEEPPVAKAFCDFAKRDSFKIKGGFLGSKKIEDATVRSLASLPTMPVMRATLLGTLMAPASQMARVIQAKVDKELSPELVQELN